MALFDYQGNEIDLQVTTDTTLTQSGVPADAKATGDAIFYVTPEDYGAVGDGTTDDTTAFASAIADGRPVKLGSKTYKANIVIERDGVTLFGDGVNNTIITPATLESPIIRINTADAETTSDIILSAVIKDLQLLGNGAVVGISMRCCQSCFIERVRIDRCYTNGLLMYGIFDSRINDCEIFRSGNTSILEDDGLNNYSIYIDKTTGMNTNACVFSGCRIEHSPRMLCMQNTQQMMFMDCKFESHVAGYSTNAEYAPIRLMSNVYGVNFVNCLLTYSGLMSDTNTNLQYNSGNPFVYVNTSGVVSASKTSILFDGCQFRTQPNYAVKYFVVNYTTFIGCVFERCTGLSNGNMLKDYGEIIGCEFVLTSSSRALLLDGNNIIVDNARIYAVAEDTSRQVVYLSGSLTKGYVRVLYSGNDRSNLAGGTISVPVEFIGLRTYGT